MLKFLLMAGAQASRRPKLNFLKPFPTRILTGLKNDCYARCLSGDSTNGWLVQSKLFVILLRGGPFGMFSKKMLDKVNKFETKFRYRQSN